MIFILKYEPYKRNKAAITLLWDLDGRNHEITLLKIKHIRLRENYGGVIPHEAKTGSGPILLTLSFPYVRDWLNEHPFKNEPNASLICSLVTGSPIRPDSLWTMMKQLRIRIKRLLQNGSITSIEEREKLNGFYDIINNINTMVKEFQDSLQLIINNSVIGVKGKCKIEKDLSLISKIKCIIV